MSKQDRQGVRTPADLERKYELSQISTQKDETSRQSLQINQLSQTLSQFIAKTNSELNSLREHVYPVGVIHISLENTSPGEVFGGEWELLAEGHLLVGMDQESEEALPELLQLNDTCYVWKRTA